MICSGDGVWIDEFDEETGEILSWAVVGTMSDKLKGNKTYKNKGNYDLSNPEAAKAYARKLAKHRVVASCDNFDKLLMNNNLTGTELKVFCYVGDGVVVDNYSYVTTKQLQELANIDKSGVSRALTGLQDGGLIRELYRNTFGVGSRVYQVAPHYFWKGLDGCRSKTIDDWYLPRRKDAGDRLISDDILL